MGSIKPLLWRTERGEVAVAVAVAEASNQIPFQTVAEGIVAELMAAEVLTGVTVTEVAVLVIGDTVATAGEVATEADHLQLCLC